MPAGATTEQCLTREPTTMTRGMCVFDTACDWLLEYLLMGRTMQVPPHSNHGEEHTYWQRFMHTLSCSFAQTARFG